MGRSSRREAWRCIYNLNYWRTRNGAEVDFIISKDKSYLPIEVKKVWEKETIPNGLKAFFKKYPEVKQAVILHSGEAREILFEDRKIYCLPLYWAEHVKELLE